MAYIQIALNHFRELQQCAERAGLTVTMDCATFCLEAKGRGRYYSLFPQFMVRVNGQFTYTQRLEAGGNSFIGWLPYRPVSWSEVSDKRLFKRFVNQSGLQSPKLVDTEGETKASFLIKDATGSFGYGLDGPFRAGQRAPLGASRSGRAVSEGETFAEEFVPGQVLKVWMWGDKPIFAHRHDFASIVGSGSKTVRELVGDKLAAVGQTFFGREDQQSIVRTLSFQEVDLDEVLSAGRKIWIDFRYGRTYEPSPARTESDSIWLQLPSAVRMQVQALGEVLGNRLTAHFGAPILCSVDAIIDEREQVWWLEANTNPMVPPVAYSAMFDTLFGATTRAPTLPDELSHQEMPSPHTSGMPIH